MLRSGLLKITSRRELCPPTAGEACVALVRVSPDGQRLAFRCDDGVDNGVYVCVAGAVTAERVVALGGAQVHELAWSPSGDQLGYVTGKGPAGGTHRSVGWASSQAEGEVGRVAGAAFAWGLRKPVLVVADLERQAVMYVEATTSEGVELGRILDDGDVDDPPSIAIPSDGHHIAFSCRSSYHDMSEVWLLARREEGPAEASLLTQIPGANVAVKLLFSPKGKSLAMHIVHRPLSQSAIIVVHGLKGDGEVIHHHDGLDATVTPAWSPDGRWMALFCKLGSPEPELALLDVRERKIYGVDGSVDVGAPRFIDDRTLTIDGDRQGLVLQLDLAAVS